MLGLPPETADDDGAGRAPDLVGVVCLRDVLAHDGPHDTTHVADLMRAPVLVPSSLPLPQVLERLRAEGEELACVLDEYGDLAGVISVEDVAEELVGEITDEHDAAGTDRARYADDGWEVPGDRHVDEVSRLIDADLPEGDYQTVGGLVVAELGRLAEPGDAVVVTIPDDDPDEPDRELRMTVREVERRVPSTVHLEWAVPVERSGSLPAEEVGR